MPWPRPLPSALRARQGRFLRVRNCNPRPHAARLRLFGCNSVPFGATLPSPTRGGGWRGQPARPPVGARQRVRTAPCSPVEPWSPNGVRFASTDPRGSLPRAPAVGGQALSRRSSPCSSLTALSACVLPCSSRLFPPTPHHYAPAPTLLRDTPLRSVGVRASWCSTQRYKSSARSHRDAQAGTWLRRGTRWRETLAAPAHPSALCALTSSAPSGPRKCTAVAAAAVLWLLVFPRPLHSPAACVPRTRFSFGGGPPAAALRGKAGAAWRAALEFVSPCPVPLPPAGSPAPRGGRGRRGPPPRLFAASVAPVPPRAPSPSVGAGARAPPSFGGRARFARPPLCPGAWFVVRLWSGFGA